MAPSDAPTPLPPQLRFNDVALSLPERQLTIGGREAVIGGRAFTLLCVLIAHRHRSLSKTELLDRVWAGVVVEENNLQVQISALRRLLGSETISTVPGRGYRFTAALEGDTTVPPPAPPSPAPAPPSDHPGNLPPRLPPLIGRETELKALHELLPRASLVSVVGPGGIGKTSLTRTLAQGLQPRFPDGVWWVELASHGDSTALADLVAQTLGLSLPNHRPLADELVAALQTQRLLMVLDNSEHLITRVCDLVARILPTAPGVVILVTSQEPLQLPGEQVFRLQPLAVPQSAGEPDAERSGAVALFTERLRQLQPGFTLTPSHLALVVDICRQLDGLALALELAAARVPLFGLSGVLERLDQRFRVLAGGPRRGPARHQTLQATLDWSHGLLNADERLVYRRLGVFTGSFTIAAAQAVVGEDPLDGWAVLDHLNALVDKSLVLAEGEPVPRLQLLQSTRAHALALLDAAGERPQALARHARFTRDQAERAVRERNSDALLQDLPNLRSAFQWACDASETELAVSLATAPAVLLAVDGAVSEALGRLLAVQALVDERLSPPLEARYWQWLGRLGVDGRLAAEQCIAALSRAAALFEQLGNRRHLHACRRHLAEAYVGRGDLEAARAALQVAEAMEGSGWPVVDVMRRLRVESLLCAEAGLLDQALETAQRALDIAEAGGVERYVLVLRVEIARMHLTQGNVREAVQRFRSLADTSSQSPNAGLTRCHALSGLIAALTAQGEFDAALAAARHAVPLLRKSGLFRARADLLAYLMSRRRCDEAAARLLGAAAGFLAKGADDPPVPPTPHARMARELIDRRCTPQQFALWWAAGTSASDDQLAALLDTD